MEVDPRDPLNAVIVNLDKAPQNDRGMVEFSSPFFILKPVDMRRGNHKLFYAINNRGNKIDIGYRAFPAPTWNSNDPLTAADVGENNILLRLGYAIVDAGWQGDVAPGNNRLVPNFPVATQPDGDRCSGALRSTIPPSPRGMAARRQSSAWFASTRVLLSFPEAGTQVVASLDLLAELASGVGKITLAWTSGRATRPGSALVKVAHLACQSQIIPIVLVR
jgi:hypothetical protein